jgi:hypothetical protein
MGTAATPAASTWASRFQRPGTSSYHPCKLQIFHDDEKLEIKNKYKLQKYVNIFSPQDQQKTVHKHVQYKVKIIHNFFKYNFSLQRCPFCYQINICIEQCAQDKS